MDKRAIAAIAGLVVLVGVVGVVVGRQSASEGAGPSSNAAEDEEAESSTEQAPVVEEDFFEVPPDDITEAFLFQSEPVSFPTGDSGEVDVVHTGRYDQQAGLLPVVLRNNSAETVVRPTVTGTALDEDGSILGSGEDQTFHPNLLGPGATAIGYVYFGAGFPKGTTFELDVDATSVSSSDSQFENIRDLVVDEARIVEGDFGPRAVGFVLNPYDYPVAGPIDVGFACLDAADGRVTHMPSSFTSKEQAGPGERLSFQVDLFDPCPVFLVGSSGFTD
ncbi:MAG: hypothetical protein ACR2KQ_03570 [Actinomycetota bacterium]